jgi:hypothetical protein
MTVLTKASSYLTNRPNCCMSPIVEAGSDTSFVALRVVGGDEMGTQCPGVQLGDPIPGGCEYGDLVLQVGEVSNL